MLKPLILLPVLYFLSGDTDRIVVEADHAVVAIPLQAHGRNLLHLPELEFLISISAHCADGGQPDSISIAVADTRKTIRGPDLLAAAPIQTSLRIAARQIAPLALQEFCVEGGPAEESRLLTSALTAQVSLRCIRGEQQSIVFDAAPLDVELSCVAVDGVPGG